MTARPFWRTLYDRLLGRSPAVTPKRKRRSRRQLLDRLIAQMGPAEPPDPPKTTADIFGRAEPPSWVPKPATAVMALDETLGKTLLAQDAANLSCNQSIVNWADSLGWANTVGALSDGVAFLGYPFLAQLALRPEFRRISEIKAKEMTRKWGKVTYAGKEPATDKITAIENEMKRLKIKAAFRRAAEIDGFFGRAHLYFDFGLVSDAELAQSIGNADALTLVKVPKGSFRGIKVIEPMWIYPASYNSTNPLAEDYYKPEHWYVQSKTVHTTRVWPIVSREVSDMLKPAFAFGGLSLSQIAMPYVENFLRTRQSISDLLHSFSIFDLATDLDQQLTSGDDEDGSGGDDDDLDKRLQLFNLCRDNRGVFVHDKDSEDFKNISAPLGGLHELQAQSQEQMATPAGIPLIKLFGITPSGLNASDDTEIRCFYDGLAADQEANFTDPIQMVIVCIQLSLFGEVDPAIGFKFEPLWTLSAKEEAEVRKMEAETDAILVNDIGAIDNMEVRERVASDPDTPYQLDMTKIIEQPEEPDPNVDLSGNDLLTPEQRKAAEPTELRKAA